MKIDLGSIKNIVFLTGAGVSQESGIKTFRDNNGLWENHRVEEVATPEAYERDPELVQRFYNLRRMQLKETRPNSAHLAIGELSRDLNYEVTVITQNVDDLHERGGARKVLHMHGELKKIRHVETGRVKRIEGEVTREDFRVWRPDIVWFGEQIKCGDEISQALGAADLFVAVGTSSQVYPAAGFVSMAKFRKIPCVELNLERTPMSSSYDYCFQGKAGEIAPAFIQANFGERA